MLKTRVSKTIPEFKLIQYVSSSAVLGAAEGTSFIPTLLLNWLQNHVFPHKSLYLRFRRSDVQHFNTAQAVQHEGTNFGTKNHSAAMKPTMGVNISSSTLCIQPNVKACKLDQMCYFDYDWPGKKWSNNLTTNYTTTFGESLIKSVRDQYLLYSARRVSTSAFDVHYKSPKEEVTKFQDTPIPLSARIRRVTVSKDGTMLCNCCCFEICGYFCEHILCVLHLIHLSAGVKYFGFTHHDIIPQYRSGYMHLGYKPSTP